MCNSYPWNPRGSFHKLQKKMLAQLARRMRALTPTFDCTNRLASHKSTLRILALAASCTKLARGCERLRDFTSLIHLTNNLQQHSLLSVRAPLASLQTVQSLSIFPFLAWLAKVDCHRQHIRSYISTLTISVASAEILQVTISFEKLSEFIVSSPVRDDRSLSSRLYMHLCEA